MNYKTYKNLSPELKEEFNFRFKDKPVFPITGLFGASSMLILTLTMFIMMSFIIATADTKYVDLVSLKDQLPNFSTIIFLTVKILSWIIIIYVGEYLIRLLIYLIQYYKWTKSNKIKFYYWWTK